MIIQNRDVDLTDAVEAAGQEWMKIIFKHDHWECMTSLEKFGVLEVVASLMIAAAPHIVSQVI